MKEDNSEQIYYSIEIEANSFDTEIWLGDDEAHLVQKEIGILKSSLMPGNYTVEFGLGQSCYPISLEENARYIQAELEAGPACKRSSPQVDID